MSLANTLETYLSERGAHYTVEHHCASLTSRECARTARIDEASLAKSVVLEDDRGFVLAVLPASCQLELGRVRAKLGRPLRLSREYEMVKLFPDCAVGAVPPLGAAYGLPTVIDSGLEGQAEIFFEAGDHETLIRMEGEEFVGLLATASFAEIACDRESLAATWLLEESLSGALGSVRRAVGAPLVDDVRWQKALRRSLSLLARAAAEHVAEAEAPDGLLAKIAEQAPRLWRRVRRLRAEHASLARACAEVLDRLESADSATSLRGPTRALLQRFANHRHHGADLVYEAFGVDIGGG